MSDHDPRVQAALEDAGRASLAAIVRAVPPNIQVHVVLVHQETGLISHDWKGVRRDLIIALESALTQLRKRPS